MSLAWHPVKEGLLAFGTDEGRVCWVDSLAARATPALSQYQHRAGVYCVAWLDTRSLVTCGDGKIVRHCIQSGKGEEMQLGEGASASGKSQVVIYERADTRLLLVGHEDGGIQVFRLEDGGSFRLLATIKSQNKLIQSLALHPLYLADGAEAEFPNFLASANNEFPVHVFDLTSVLEAGSEPGQPEIIVTPTVSLTGHLQRVIELAWCPHVSSLLCSVSYDFSCQVIITTLSDLMTSCYSVGVGRVQWRLSSSQLLWTQWPSYDLCLAPHPGRPRHHWL